MILAFLFRKEKLPIPKATTRTKVTDYVPSALLVITILLLVVAIIPAYIYLWIFYGM